MEHFKASYEGYVPFCVEDGKVIGIDTYYGDMYNHYDVMPWVIEEHLIMADSKEQARKSFVEAMMSHCGIEEKNILPFEMRKFRITITELVS